MKLLIALTATMLGWIFVSSPMPNKEVKGDFSPVAVLELFTSQGCSSCPPADALLNKIIKENHTQKVIGLSFHVDYWNYLGWADPYSNADYTKRQSWYNEKLQSGVYTPQVVVNGINEFVGGNKIASDTKIREALSKPALVAIDLSLSENKLNYHLKGQFVNTVLSIATVQNETTNFVKRGENSGQKLTHNNVVLSLESLKIKSENGEIMLKLPEKASKVIVFVQDIKNGNIIGVSQIDL